MCRILQQGRFGRTVVVQLTENGCRVLEKSGYNTEKVVRHYGLIHEFWRDKVKRHYEGLGYRVSSEKRLNGERADLVAEKDEERIAIEVETGNSNAVDNIKKCLRAGFDLVISVPVNRQTEAEIKERLKKDKLEKRGSVLVISPEKFE